MHARWPVLLLALGSLCACARADAQRAYDRQPAPDFLFESGPFRTDCDPPVRRGSGAYAVLVGPPPAPHVVRRTDSLSFTRADVPALTLAADPDSEINIQGTEAQEWAVRLCAMGGGSSESEAADVLRQVAIQRQSGIVNVTTPTGRRRVALATLVVDGPRDAPVVVTAAYSAITVRGMTAPVRVSSMHARVAVLGTSGLVNAASDVVDFASDRGRVFLNGSLEIDLKMMAARFDGSVDAQAQRAVRVLLPPRFESSIEAVVPSADGFVCRADICSDFKETVQGPLRIYRYAGKGAAATGPHADDPVVRLRSEDATVVIDTIGRAAGR